MYDSIRNLLSMVELGYVVEFTHEYSYFLFLLILSTNFYLYFSVTVIKY